MIHSYIFDNRLARYIVTSPSSAQSIFIKMKTILGLYILVHIRTTTYYTGVYKFIAWKSPILELCSLGNTAGTRRSVEHCTPHADGAWLNELGWP